MGVTIHYRGTLEDLARLEEAIGFAEMHAAKSGWGFKQVDLDARKGAIVLPHHHCEVVSVVFDRASGSLVEADTGESKVFTKTQFADFATHMAVCRFLRELCNRFVRDLTVVDETEYFETGRAESFQKSADVARAAMNALFGQRVREPGRVFEVGPYRFVSPEADRVWSKGFDVHGVEEFAQVPEPVRDFVVSCDRSLREAVAMEGAVLDASFESIEAIESLLGVFDGRGEPKEREAFANLAAAYLGRSICEQLGAVWVHSGDEGLCVTNVGGTGMRVNPFDVLAARSEWGPVHGIQWHFSSIRAEVSRLQALLAV